MEFYEEIKKVETKDNFVTFIDLLISDYKNNREEWENKTLEEYLESMKSWLEDMEWYYKNTSQYMPDDINWNFFANVLYSGKIYE